MVLVSAHETTLVLWRRAVVGVPFIDRVNGTELASRIPNPSDATMVWAHSFNMMAVRLCLSLRVSKILAALPIEIIAGNRFTAARVPVPLLYLFLITSGGSRAHRVRECGKDRRRLGELEGR
jgi:hypothetical protein